MSLSYYFSSEYLFTVDVNQKYLLWWIIFFALIFVAGNVVYLILKKKNNFPALKVFAKQIWYFGICIGVLGLVTVFARYENLPTLGWRIFTWLTLVLFLLANIWLIYYWFVKTRQAIIQHANMKRKEKWLKKR